MKKEEVLARNKKTGVDEREEMIDKDSCSYGLITVLVLMVLFYVWKLIHGVNSYEFISIFNGLLATMGFYKFKKFKSKRFLIAGIIGTLTAIGTAIGFFLG